MLQKFEGYLISSRFCNKFGSIIMQLLTGQISKQYNCKSHTIFIYFLNSLDVLKCFTYSRIWYHV